MVGVTTYSLINQITKNKFYASRESARERIAVRSARSKRRNSGVRNERSVLLRRFLRIIEIITNRKSTQKRIDFKVEIITLSAHKFDIDGTEIKESEGANRA